jgi:hypothetical protein
MSPFTTTPRQAEEGNPLRDISSLSNNIIERREPNQIDPNQLCPDWIASESMSRRDPRRRCLIVVGDRVVQIAFVPIGVAAQQISEGILGMQADLDVEIGKRALQIALQSPQVSAVSMGFLVRRVETDGFIQIGNRAITAPISTGADTRVWRLAATEVDTKRK